MLRTIKIRKKWFGTALRRSGRSYGGQADRGVRHSVGNVGWHRKLTVSFAYPAYKSYKSYSVYSSTPAYQVAATTERQNTSLFLKGGGGMGEGILRCRRSAFSREKNFSPSPISQRFANKKKTRRRQFRGKTLAPPPQGCGAMSAIISDYIT